jgi:hypothetical protein
MSVATLHHAASPVFSSVSPHYSICRGAFVQITDMTIRHDGMLLLWLVLMSDIVACISDVQNHIHTLFSCTLMSLAFEPDDEEINGKSRCSMHTRVPNWTGDLYLLSFNISHGVCYCGAVFCLFSDSVVAFRQLLLVLVGYVHRSCAWHWGTCDACSVHFTDVYVCALCCCVCACLCADSTCIQLALLITLLCDFHFNQLFVILVSMPWTLKLPRQLFGVCRAIRMWWRWPAAETLFPRIQVIPGTGADWPNSFFSQYARGALWMTLGRKPCHTMAC